jgi:isopenicillin N synthase-like dioxygenase
VHHWVQDLFKACKETGFFFIHNTNIDEFTVKRVRWEKARLDAPPIHPAVAHRRLNSSRILI